MIDCCFELFSAAKAPYRATFRVQTVGIDQVEHCADPDYEFISDASNQYFQMAIFKVGDDVRQVNENKNILFSEYVHHGVIVGYSGLAINASLS